MSDMGMNGRAVSRRKFLAMGGGLAAAGTVGSWIDPWSILVSPAASKSRLTDADAMRVRDSEFASVGQFRQLHREADRVGDGIQRGLRSSGSDDEARYVDGLRQQLESSGVVDLHFESVPMRRWTVRTWSLELVGGAADGPVQDGVVHPVLGADGP